jgi:hypothetical protein
MKINFWQALGIVIVIVCGIAYYIRTQHKVDAPTQPPPSATQRSA